MFIHPTDMKSVVLSLALIFAVFTVAPAQDRIDAERLDLLFKELDSDVENRAKLTQVMVDMIFSFSELGFQEFETSRYITSILEENGFEIEYGISGIPTSWWASWGTGEPVIALGSDIDGIPKANQKPGVAYHDPLVAGAPGHGEGHNSGQAVNVTAALALKEMMQREALEGTIVLWPGVAEELVASKAWLVRDGRFRNVDLVFFTHVSNNMSVSYGQPNGTGLISVEFTFTGEAAHGAGAPWRGRSALDAVELMNTGWNFRREHLRPLQRSHYVITNGGDQPNVVPAEASVWYYFREMTYENIRRNFEIGITMAKAAALMTDTEMTYRILGTAWPRHFNKVIAETMYEHIKWVGLPTWSDDDQTLAVAVQKEVGSDPDGLKTELDTLKAPVSEPSSGGSDDIGDVSWAVPTVTLRFPSNIPGLQGHHWSSAIAMATPIAHKGATAGAKVVARTALEFFARPDLAADAWAYFNDVQNKDMSYSPFISEDDSAPVYLNEGIMRQFRADLERFYFRPDEFDTLLDQLGISYPTVRDSDDESK